MPFGAPCVAGALLAFHAAGAGAGEFSDTFAAEPGAGGWKLSGDATLFAWSQARQAVDVTWDSSRPNTFFHRSLNTVLTKADSFQLSFVLRMRDSRAGSTPGKPAEFPIAIGLMNRQMTTNANSYRGAGVSGTYGVRNIVEWNFFPDAGFGDTWATTVVSSNNVFAFAHTFPLALVNGDTYRVTLAYTASNQILRTFAVRNNGAVESLEPISLSSTPDFRVDAVSITSYSDAIQAGAPAYHGSVLAHGSVEEIALSLPPPPVGDLAVQWNGGAPAVGFLARSNWVHTLERSIHLDAWSAAAAPVQGAGERVVIRDTNGPAARAFYRVRSERR